jgi:hypothetical protein
MNQDTEHLRLLAIFHYVVGALAAPFSFFPLIYTTIGTIFIFAARHGTAKPGEELPPEFLYWIFAMIGSVLFLIGLTMAICILIAGRPVSNTPRKVLWSAVHLLSVQCFGTPVLDVQSACVGATIVVNFDPATAHVTPCAWRYPDHVGSLLRRCACLGCRHWF